MRFSSKFFVRFMFLFLCLIFNLNADHHHLAVCTIFKNCAPFLKEWIEYHRMVGVDHFFLFDNASHDHPQAVLKKYIDKGIVTLIHWPNRDEKLWGGQAFAWVSTTQLPAYDLGCALALNKYKWLAFIDSDEFLVPMTFSTLTEFLQAHEDAPGVCLNWAVYGTSNVIDIPARHLMIEMLTKRAKLNDPINIHTKSIVKPDQYTGWAWPPHACSYLNGAAADTVPMEEARVNHYINRTIKYFYSQKVKHKQRMDNVKWDEATLQNFLKLGNDENDDTMSVLFQNCEKEWAS